MARGMTAEAASLLRERYAEEKNAVLAEALGVSERTVLRWASSLGLRKSEAFLARVRWDAELAARYLRLTGVRVGGFGKGERGGTAGSFGRRRLTAEQEAKRIAAIRATAWEERKREIRGEPLRTRWKRKFGK